MENHNCINFKDILRYSVAGGIAGISVDIFLFPIDSIKTRLQASTKDHDFVQSSKNISKFRGFVSSISASFPCSATFWIIYEISKIKLLEYS